MITERIRHLMHIEGISLDTLSNKSNVPIETLRSIIYKKIDNPKLSTTIQIAKALGVSLDYLVGLSDYKQDEIKVLDTYNSLDTKAKQIMLDLFELQKQINTDEKDYNKLVLCFTSEQYILHNKNCNSSLNVEL